MKRVGGEPTDSNNSAKRGRPKRGEGGQADNRALEGEVQQTSQQGQACEVPPPFRGSSLSYNFLPSSLSFIADYRPDNRPVREHTDTCSEDQPVNIAYSVDGIVSHHGGVNDEAQEAVGDCLPGNRGEPKVGDVNADTFQSSSSAMSNISSPLCGISFNLDGDETYVDPVDVGATETVVAVDEAGENDGDSLRRSPREALTYEGGCLRPAQSHPPDELCDIDEIDRDCLRESLTDEDNCLQRIVTHPPEEVCDIDDDDDSFEFLATSSSPEAICGICFDVIGGEQCAAVVPGLENGGDTVFHIGCLRETLNSAGLCASCDSSGGEDSALERLCRWLRRMAHRFTLPYFRVRETNTAEQGNYDNGV